MITNQLLHLDSITSGIPSGSVVNSLPAMQETWVQSLGWEDPLEEGMATHSSTLAWRIPWTEELASYSPQGFTESDMTEATKQQQRQYHLKVDYPNILKKESWAPKNLCFWNVVLEKTLANPLDCKEIQPVHPKENQSWIFIGRTDAEAEASILWPPNAKNWLIWKDPNAGKDWRQKEKGITEDEMVRWHDQLNGHEFEQAPEVGDGQGSLEWCRPWGHKNLDTTEWRNWSSKFSKLTLFCSHFPRKGKCSNNVSQRGLIWRDLLKEIIVTEHIRKDYLQLLYLFSLPMKVTVLRNINQFKLVLS